MTHVTYSLKKLGRTFKLQKKILKTEMNHDEVDGENYSDKKDEWLDNVKQDVLCTAFSYASYCKVMQEITGFPRKECLSAPGLGWRYLSGLRTEEVEPIYTFIDKYMRHFVGRSIKGGRVCAFNQFYKSKNRDDILKIISKELNFKANVYDILEAYMKYKNDHLQIIKEEFESKFDDYRQIVEEEKEKDINKKIGELPVYRLLQQSSLYDFLWGYDAVILYPSAMSNPKSIYPRIETGYAYTIDMNGEHVKKIMEVILPKEVLF